MCVPTENKCIFSSLDFSVSLIFFFFGLKMRAKEARNVPLRALSIGKGFEKLENKDQHSLCRPRWLWHTFSGSLLS